MHSSVVETPSTTKRPIWFLNGKTYDLRQWLPLHPGGSLFLVWHGRDITITFNTYHKDPAKHLKVLKKYEVAGTNSRPNQFHVPESARPLLAPDFDARKDIISYDFDPYRKELFLNACRHKVLQPEVQSRIIGLDRAFDIVTWIICVTYLAILFMWLSGWVVWYALAPCFCLLKTAMAGSGHYFLHRKRPCFMECLFDVNYVGLALTAVDGHNVGHHSFALTKADPKKGFFGGMMSIPRLWRIPAYTLHKLGHFFTGMLIKGVEVHTFADSPLLAFAHLRNAAGTRVVPRIIWNFWFIHCFMLLEFVLAWYRNLLGAWFGQFVLSLWINTFLVLASHDFEDDKIMASEDWGKYQVLNSMDLKITGNPWIDCFLSAGLSPHRVHHIFPYQRSGWANVYCTPIVKKCALNFGIDWLEPRCFYAERLPELIKSYLLSPVADPINRKPRYASFREEHFSWACYKESIKFVLLGFIGLGSI